MQKQEEPWFKEWFNSPYYHILYKNRDRSEAEDFISNMASFLEIKRGERVLDLACGKGRHAIFLNELGFDVTGADLSEQNIEEASKFSNSSLRFVQQDMREEITGEKFHYIFNLFTSFGYFDNIEENKKVLSAVHNMLPTGGCFVLDFFNEHQVISQLKPYEEKVLEEITFKIFKSHTDSHVFKTIEFSDLGREFRFVEKVQTFSKKDFELMLSSCGFEVINCFGDYQLSAFQKETSSRLILVCKKKLN